MSVSTFGWMPSATLVLMIARSGNMQAAPIEPVKCHSLEWRVVCAPSGRL